MYHNHIIRYLKFSDVCNNICYTHDLTHPMDRPAREIALEIDKCVRYRLIPEISEIKVLSNSMDGFCLGYYPLNPSLVSQPTPAWDSFISSMPVDGTRECFMAWIYSIFKDDNFGRQMMWIHGKGESGKSQVCQALFKKMQMINPDIVTALEPLGLTDRFSSASYTKKRLTIAQDCTDRLIVRHQLVKNITGNDTTAVIKKGFDKKEDNIYSKLLVTSNYSPWVS